RLDGHRGRTDRALAARDVVPAGVDEEQPELRGRRDRLGHDGDEHPAMPARLQTEARAQMIEVLLEPAPLVGDGLARQAANAARDQTHADARGVEVDGRDHAIRAHVEPPYELFFRSCIAAAARRPSSSAETSSMCVETCQVWPNGSSSVPRRSP